ncbi:DUF4136 domain-containing protein [Novosphingobium piscinae]|uniref:DUF4136 domain-containing protein n=1 Tax=Novosphingobium piscinae TaxID=1507448 RepID=A0A7X1FY10_9SPHN|nr:DUF4136 domain-containing protein [Novosphingobium piscinae]MBC2669095.1 DUF4136 domain-containing protein [Novosphingobium piscinae]
MAFRLLPPRMAILAPLLAAAGCVAPTGPVEVTRFHLPDTTMLGRGPVAIVPASGMDPASLELRAFAGAVGRELQRLGYREVGAAEAAQVAEVRFERHTAQPERQTGPVSVGVGGSTGSFGSGVGVGLGFNLSGRPKPQTETRLGVMIREKGSGRVVWEGRASFSVRADSPLATTELGAAQLAAGLFRDFPGRSGETVLVKPTP